MKYRLLPSKILAERFRWTESIFRKTGYLQSDLQSPPAGKRWIPLYLASVMLAWFLPANNGIIHKRDNTMIQKADLLIKVTRYQWQITLRDNKIILIEESGKNYDTFFRRVQSHAKKRAAFRYSNKQLIGHRSLTLDEADPTYRLCIAFDPLGWQIEVFTQLAGWKEKMWIRKFGATGKNFGSRFTTKLEQAYMEIGTRPVNAMFTINALEDI